MVTASFQPSNAGAQLQQQAFGVAEGFQNLFARAEAMKQSRERLDMEKQRFAREASMAALDTKEREARLKQLNNQLEIQDKTKSAQIEIIEANRVEATEQIAESKARESLFAQLAPALRKFDDIAPDDVDGLLTAHASLMQRFGKLGQGATAARFAELAGPALENVNNRILASQVLVDRAANAKLFDLRVAIALNDTEALATMLRDPVTQRAAKSMSPMGQQLSDEITAAVKMLGERQTKVAEKKAAEQVAIDKEGRKMDRELSADGWEGQAPTREEAVKFRTEAINTEEIVASLDELTNLARQYQATSDPAKKAELYKLAEQASGMMVGKLRLPLTGPGAFTDSERGFVADTIGNPTKIFSLSSIEFAKLDAMRTKLVRGVDIMGRGLGYKRSEKPTGDKTADGQTFSGDINGKPIEGKWVTDGKGRKGVFGNDGNFYPVTP